MLTWELLGTVLGAGIASGREVASFFTQYGIWSFPGIILGGCMLIYLANSQLPSTWQGRWPGMLWQLLLSALLIVTGGAMLAGGGEVAALVLPLRGAYGIGMVVTLVLAWILAHRTQTGLAWTSCVMLGLLFIVIVSGLRLPAENASVLSSGVSAACSIRAAAYGGFNAALMLPILSKANGITVRQKRRAIWAAGVVFMLLLMAGNIVLLRHPALMNEPLPFIHIMHRFGKVGYCLAAASLYFAILSTLTACFRGLGRRWYAAAGILLIAMLGFSGVVEVAYPAVGAACLCMLVAAKFTNCFRKPFQSRRDMI